MKTIPVLICGAGPVGLSLSLALSRLGIENLLLEKRAVIYQNRMILVYGRFWHEWIRLFA